MAPTARAMQVETGKGRLLESLGYQRARFMPVVAAEVAVTGQAVLEALVVAETEVVTVPTLQLVQIIPEAEAAVWVINLVRLAAPAS